MAEWLNATGCGPVMGNKPSLRVQISSVTPRGMLRESAFDLHSNWRTGSSPVYSTKITIKENIMGTYIGHCDSCDITLEAEGMISNLLNKGYSRDKINDIFAFAQVDLKNLSDESVQHMSKKSS